MVTAELEAITGISLIVYLAVNHLAAWCDYVGGFFLFIALFVCMQKALTMMVGMQYRELPKLMMKQIRKMRSR